MADNLYHNYFQPACKALKIHTASGSAPRLYDLRHTYATLALSAREHYIAVSRWLGHSSFVLTLSTYADYIREDDTTALTSSDRLHQKNRSQVAMQVRGSAYG